MNPYQTPKTNIDVVNNEVEIDCPFCKVGKMEYGFMTSPSIVKWYKTIPKPFRWALGGEDVGHEMAGYIKAHRCPACFVVVIPPKNGLA